jgi:hypothetical protein
MTHYALTFSFPGTRTFTVRDVPENRVAWWRCTFHWKRCRKRVQP